MTRTIDLGTSTVTHLDVCIECGIWGSYGMWSGAYSLRHKLRNESIVLKSIICIKRQKWVRETMSEKDVRIPQDMRLPLVLTKNTFRIISLESLSRPELRMSGHEQYLSIKLGNTRAKSWCQISIAEQHKVYRSAYHWRWAHLFFLGYTLLSWISI